MMSRLTPAALAFLLSTYAITDVTVAPAEDPVGGLSEKTRIAHFGRDLQCRAGPETETGRARSGEWKLPPEPRLRGQFLILGLISAAALPAPLQSGEPHFSARRAVVRPW